MSLKLSKAPQPPARSRVESEAMTRLVAVCVVGLCVACGSGPRQPTVPEPPRPERVAGASAPADGVAVAIVTDWNVGDLVTRSDGGSLPATQAAGVAYGPGPSWTAAVRPSGEWLHLTADLGEERETFMISFDATRPVPLTFRDRGADPRSRPDYVARGGALAPALGLVSHAHFVEVESVSGYVASSVRVVDRTKAFPYAAAEAFDTAAHRFERVRARYQPDADRRSDPSVSLGPGWTAADSVDVVRAVSARWHASDGTLEVTFLERRRRSVRGPAQPVECPPCVGECQECVPEELTSAAGSGALVVTFAASYSFDRTGRLVRETMYAPRVDRDAWRR